MRIVLWYPLLSAVRILPLSCTISTSSYLSPLPAARCWLNTLANSHSTITSSIHGHHIILRLVSIYLQIVSFYLPFAMSSSYPKLTDSLSARLSRWWHLWFLSVFPNRTKLFVFSDSINFMLRRRLCKTITPILSSETFSPIPSHNRRSVTQDSLVCWP